MAAQGLLKTTPHRTTHVPPGAVVSRQKRRTNAGTGRKRRKPVELRFGLIEFYRVLDSLPSWWRPYYIMLVVTGMRISELCRLQPDSLDHRELTIRVSNQIGIRTIYVA